MINIIISIILFFITPVYSKTSIPKRPDLKVEFLQKNPQIWWNNSYYKLSLAESLFQTGRYQESLLFSYQLLLQKLSFYMRGKNYILIAQNYENLNQIKKSRFYFQKAITRNNQYYFFLFARFEEYQENYIDSINLYQQALSMGDKDYISNAYVRTLHKALIYYKFRDPLIYQRFLHIAKENPYFPKAKIRIIEKAFVF